MPVEPLFISNLKPDFAASFKDTFLDIALGDGDLDIVQVVVPILEQVSGLEKLEISQQWSEEWLDSNVVAQVLQAIGTKNRESVVDLALSFHGIQPDEQGLGLISQAVVSSFSNLKSFSWTSNYGPSDDSIKPVLEAFKSTLTTVDFTDYQKAVSQPNGASFPKLTDASIEYVLKNKNNLTSVVFKSHKTTEPAIRRLAKAFR